MNKIYSISEVGMRFASRNICSVCNGWSLHKVNIADGFSNIMESTSRHGGIYHLSLLPSLNLASSCPVTHLSPKELVKVRRHRCTKQIKGVYTGLKLEGLFNVPAVAVDADRRRTFLRTFGAGVGHRLPLGPTAQLRHTLSAVDILDLEGHVVQENYSLGGACDAEHRVGTVGVGR